MQRWSREIISWTAVVIAVFVLLPYFLHWPRIGQLLAVGLLVLIVLSPYIFFEMYWPRIFDASTSEDGIDYEFASVEYANEFQQLNEK